MIDEFPLYQKRADGSLVIQQYPPDQCSRCVANDRSVYYRDIFTSDGIYLDSNSTYRHEIHKLCDACFRFRSNLVWG